MVQKTALKYIDTFRGLSSEVWWLAWMTLINRAGSMVIPFLSLYLTTGLNFTYSQVGWIMSAFGLGSVVGTRIGGYLTDKIGNYKVMLGSLFLSGIGYVLLQFLEDFYALCAGIFVVMMLADAFRPAMFVAVGTFSKPENKTRSISLIRLAINLGFSAGPAIGGLIIERLSYGGLFWIDGLTCIAAGALLLWVLSPKRSRVVDEIDHSKQERPKDDKVFLWFLLAMMLFGFVFMQYFSTIPLYYSEIRGLSESQIGFVLALNGLIVFLIEMPIVDALEKKKSNKLVLMLLGAVLLVLSYLVLTWFSWLGIVIIGMLLMSIGEVIAFPFSNTWAMERSKRGKQGAYMSLYAVSFSVSNVFAHNVGMQLIDFIGYDQMLYIMSVLGLFCAFILFRVKRMTDQENTMP